MEQFIRPVEILRKKRNTFRGITFFPFLTKRPKFSVPFVWITSARLYVETKRKIYRYFVTGTTQSRSCFRCPKKYQYHITKIFHRNFRTNGKRLRSIDLISRKNKFAPSTLFFLIRKKISSCHTLFLSFFAVVLHDYNAVLQKRQTSQLQITFMEELSNVLPKILFPVFMFAFIFSLPLIFTLLATACWPLAFLIFSPPL